MRTVPIDHGQLEIAVEGCTGNGLPIHDERRLGSPATGVLILVNPWGERLRLSTGDLDPDHGLDIGGHLRQLLRQACEQLALGIVGREPADEAAVLGVSAEFFQFFPEVLHVSRLAHILEP